jgi:hypothetical protein
MRCFAERTATRCIDVLARVAVALLLQSDWTVDRKQTVTTGSGISNRIYLYCPMRCFVVNTLLPRCIDVKAY